MLILPAIDLRGGKCVRLKQGDYSQETVFGDDPVEIARKWVSVGTQILHLVDLDGAKQGHPVHADVVRRIVYTTRVPCQLGGGIRTDRDLETVFSWGVQRAVIGTRALQEPQWVREVILRYPNRIVLGLDARGGKVATHGWLETSELNAFEVAQQFDGLPLAGIVFTDISKDGMLNGPNLDALGEMSRVVRTPVIASGGITSLDDVRNLLELDLAGAIIGRALYEGQLDLRDVLDLVRAHSQARRDANP